jgi:hypothetical protein
MSVSNTVPPATPTLDSAALRIVLFGIPDAGKSSLLGALAQAAQTQEHLLNGHLTDLSRGLVELQHRLYDDQPRETLEEVVPYAVAFEPFTTAGPQQAANRLEAVLIDCDGRVANDLLTRRRSLEAGSNEGSLASAVLEADALLLVVDAAASPAQVDADFKEFGQFLRFLEGSRGRRSDIGGLPVFLVLTKCDLLAQSTDTPAAWMERIEERKRQLDSRFQEFLARQKEEGPLPFGRIDLHLWATAVKRPVLSGSPAKPREPYGVAELFRQALADAQVFRQRRERSGKRLLWTVASGSGLIAAMLALVAYLGINTPHEQPGVRKLQDKIESYRSREPPTPSNRLRGVLQNKIADLTDLKTDPNFGALPAEDQAYVQERLQELQDYQNYKERLLLLGMVQEVRNERELDSLEKRLEELTLPKAHEADWRQTEAALLRVQRREEIKVVRAAATELADWYAKLRRRGEALWAFSKQEEGPLAWPDWQNKVRSLLDESEMLPRETDKLPGSKPGSSLTYATVSRFDRIVAARNSWESVRQRLQRVLDLSTALGLAGPVPGRTPLDIPAGFSADQAAGRLEELRKLYPRYQEEFTLTDLPEAIAGEIRRTARIRYKRALEAGQEVVLRHLREVSPEGRETVDGWHRVRSWLANPSDLAAWRTLATVLARLQNPTAGDPVTDLATFLGKDQFTLVLSRLTLEIPDASRVRPDGTLAVYHRQGDESKPKLIFELFGDERRDARRQTTQYTFRSRGGTTITYRPGDILWADLPVKSGGNPDWFLTWARSRSQMYQFERLVRPPRLHQKDREVTEGDVAKSVSLEVSPDNGVPRVPDLMPVVPVPLGKP